MASLLVFLGHASLTFTVGSSFCLRLFLLCIFLGKTFLYLSKFWFLCHLYKLKLWLSNYATPYSVCIFLVSWDLSLCHIYFIISSVQFSHSAVSNSLRPHKLQHARPPCPSPTLGVHPNPCPLSQWCHPTILSSIVPFSSCPQSFPAPGSFQMSQLFTSGGQSIEVSASATVLPINNQDWSPLGWTGWISLQSKELSRVFSNTTVQKHQFCTQLSL